MEYLPAFPLHILPIPGELLPLHIFERRYRQLLSDAEESDMEFIIFPEGNINPLKLGTIIKLEQIIRKFESGESDIIVRAIDFCIVHVLNPFYRQKLYPGAEITRKGFDSKKYPDIRLMLEYTEWQQQIRKPRISNNISVYTIANALQLSLKERIKFAGLSENRKQRFLTGMIRFEKEILRAEEHSKRIYHLN
ncbi:MAG: LON peptidase substrate-binding domain-containing protein [Cyclobacteriaceae bacterium]